MKWLKVGREADPGRSRRRVRLSGVIVGAALVVGSIGVAPAFASPATSSVGASSATLLKSGLTSDYAALGDSYSSGEGNGNYAPGSNTATDKCHRSSTAYGPELAKRFSVGSFQYVACSGAVTADLFAANHEYPGEGPQLSSLSAQTSVVTLTIGGNDVGFASILEACVYGIGYNAPGCSQNPAVTGMVSYNLAALANPSTSCPTTGLPVSEASGTPITSWVCVLLAIHAAAPHAVIDLVGYPPLFGNFTQSSCQVGSLDGFYPLYISQGDASWLNSVQAQSVTDEENAVTIARGMGVRAYFANVSPEFSGHGFCDTSTTFFHPITVTTTLGGTVTAPGSMHPNAQGISADVHAIERSL